jgi:hypothetical protein
MMANGRGKNILSPLSIILDHSGVHKIVAIIPAEFDFNMFVTFSAKIAIRAEFYPSILFIKTN